MARFWNFIRNAATETEPENIELRIEGDIVDDDWAWVYEWFGETCTSPNSFRNELKEFKGKNLTVWIDSYGGSVFAAAGIYNALKEHKGKVTVKIDGKAMSAASVIAMAGDNVLMSPVSILMIHNPLTSANGYASDLRKTADVLDVVKETIINAYERSGKTREEISQMMDDETYMSSNVALKNSFIDGVLYDDKPLEVDNMKEVNFSRLAVSNATNEAIKHMLDMEKSIINKDETEKAKLLIELDLL